MNTEPTIAHSGRPLIVAEIGSDRVKIMRTAPSRGGISVTHLHVARIQSAVDDAAGVMQPVLADWPDAGQTPVILCLPRQMVTIRNIELPSVDPAEIDGMIEIQAARLTPWSREEVLFDYSLLGSAQPGYRRAMICIAQRSALRQRFYAAEEAGLNPERFTISSEGLLCWSAQHLQDGETAAIVDVDSFYADFMLVRDGQPLYSRAILTGANDLDAASEAAVAKLTGEVAQSLETAARENDGAQPARLIVTGAAAGAEKLAAALGEKTGLPCETVDPLAAVKREPAAAAVPDNELATVSLTALLGMAAAAQRLEINLLPESVRMRRQLVRRSHNFSRVGMAVMTLLLSLSLLAHIRFFARREQLRAVRARVENTAPGAERVERLHALLYQAERYLDPRLAAGALLYAVHPGIPEDVALESLELDVEQRRLVVSGTAPEIRDVRTLVNRLEELTAFRNVREDGAMSQDARSGRFKFKVVCPLEVEP